MASITKKGGYREIPKEVILKEAGKLGIPGEELPEVVVVRGKFGWWSSEEPKKVFVPRRRHKGQVPGLVRHELAHYKLGIPTTKSKYETPRGYTRVELETEKLSEGKLSTDRLLWTVADLVTEFSVPEREALRIVFEEARRLGTSEATITRAKHTLSKAKKYTREAGTTVWKTQGTRGLRERIGLK